MAKVKRWEGEGAEGYSFDCPGCGRRHGVTTGGAATWSFNGDVDRPTFQPSVLVRSGHFNPAAAGQPCWCSFEDRLGRPAPSSCLVCHSFVVDGRIQFLTDCTHALAGQTVDLPDIASA